jgi:hypothetical protein
MDLTPQQQSVLVGTILGDGSLAKHGRHCRLHVKHKADHVALVDYKHAVFANFVSMPVHRFDQKLNGKGYPSAQFATRTSPVFSEWRQRFYRVHRKIVPDEIMLLLDPLSVAVWFMDDGAADYASVWLDSDGQVWADYPTAAPEDDQVRPLVWASEQTDSRADLTHLGYVFTRIGWSR